jgi:hypothetical protein
LIGRTRIVGIACLAVAFGGWPRVVAADESFTEFALDFGAGARLTQVEDTATDTEVVLSLLVLKLRKDRYRSYGIELSYAGNDTLEFFGGLGRIEVGLGAPRFNRGSFGDRASAWVTYLAVTGGYGSGTVWDTEYIELYGAEDEVEVLVSGFPAYGAIGLRRIGGLAVRFEAVAGGILVTDKEADLPEGDAPSMIASVGFRVAIGYDTFLYTWTGI